MDKWIKRWQVPSYSSNYVYIVAIDHNGNYGCSCPVWKFKRKQCKHINEVINSSDGLQAELFK